MRGKSKIRIHQASLLSRGIAVVYIKTDEISPIANRHNKRNVFLLFTLITFSYLLI